MQTWLIVADAGIKFGWGYVDSIFEDDGVLGNRCSLTRHRTEAKKFVCTRNEILFIINTIKPYAPKYTLTPQEYNP